MLDAAPDASWQQVDIADALALASTFARITELFGRIDFVIHFAAFYHFGADWRQEYESTNLEGTANVLRFAKDQGVRRVIFASSVAAMQPPPPSIRLTEESPTADYIPYAKSKSVGEKMVRDASDHLPGIVLRIGGVFSDWCELPPLSALVRLWAGRSILRRVVVGDGTTGIPYIHRDDLVQVVRRCIDCHERLGPYEVFLASQEGAVLHKQIFAAVVAAAGRTANSQPVAVSPAIAKLGVYWRLTCGWMVRNVPFERPWMLDYADRPWIVDTTYTQKKLRWSCTEGKGVLDRLPTILEHFWLDRRKWERRNRTRNLGLYEYYTAPG